MQGSRAENQESRGLLFEAAQQESERGERTRRDQFFFLEKNGKNKLFLIFVA